MYGSKNILTYNTLVKHDGILVVVTLPRHVGNQQVLTQCQLSVFGRVAFGQNLALYYPIALITDRTEVDGHILVGTTELGNTVFFESRLEADELLVFCTVIENTDGGSIYILNNTAALCCNHSA